MLITVEVYEKSSEYFWNSSAYNRVAILYYAYMHKSHLFSQLISHPLSLSLCRGIASARSVLNSGERPRASLRVQHGGRICARVWAVTFNSGEISLDGICRAFVSARVEIESPHPPLRPVAIWSRTAEPDFRTPSGSIGGGGGGLSWKITLIFLYRETALILRLLHKLSGQRDTHIGESDLSVA